MSNNNDLQSHDPTETFVQACKDIINQWRVGDLDEPQSANALMTMIREAQTLDHKANQARGYSALSFLYSSIGKFDKAINYLKVSIRLFEQINHAEGLASVYNSLGEIYRLKGDFAQASLMYEKTLELSESPETKNVNSLFALGNYGLVVLANEQYEKAKQILEETLLLLQPYVEDEVNIKWLTPPSAVKCEYQSALAEAFAYLGDYEKSWEIIEDAHDIALKLSLKFEMAMIYRTIAQLVIAQPDHQNENFSQNFHYYFDESYNLFMESGSEGDAALTRLAYAQLLLKQGEFEKAKSSFEQVSDQLMRLGMFALARQASSEARQLK